MNRKTVVIHCGFHKTGSSTLQVYLTRLHDSQQDERFCYPKFGRGGWPFAHHDLIRAFNDNSKSASLNISKEFEDSQRPFCIISAETLSQTRNLHVLAQLGHAFEQAQLELVFYVRDYDVFLESMYGEDIKRGRTTEAPWEYASRMMREFSFLKQIERAQQLMPQAKITILKFNGPTIIEDFNEVIFGTRVPSETPIWENRSLSAEFTMALREIYQHPDFNAELILRYIDTAYAIERQIGVIEPRTGFFTVEQRLSIFEHYFDETMTLSKTYLGTTIPFWSGEKSIVATRATGIGETMKIFLALLGRGVIPN